MLLQVVAFKIEEEKFTLTVVNTNEPKKLPGFNSKSWIGVANTYVLKPTLVFVIMTGMQ